MTMNVSRTQSNLNWILEFCKRVKNSNNWSRLPIFKYRLVHDLTRQDRSYVGGLAQVDQPPLSGRAAPG
jgi:hypothetical protein